MYRSHLAYSFLRRGLARGDLGDVAGAAADARRAVALGRACRRGRAEDVVPDRLRPRRAGGPGRPGRLGHPGRRGGERGRRRDGPPA